MTTETIIQATLVNYAFLRVDCEQDIRMEISEYFKFEVPGAKFTPMYRMGRWDGLIKLFNLGSRLLPSGLYSKLIEFCTTREYKLEVVKSEQYGVPSEDESINYDDISEYINSLNLHGNGNPITVRDYQVNGVYTALRHKNCVLNSVTGSGKSMMIYCIFRYLTEELGLRCLLIVPTVALTTQMKADFKDYSSHNGYDVEKNLHLISAGADKTVNKPIVISTFQSLAKISPEWVSGFDCIMSDEAHKISADSFKKIYDVAYNAKYRLGCTGTIHETKCNILQMEAITGQIFPIATAKDLISAGQLVPLKIKGIVLQYQHDVCKLFKKVEYEDEIKWVVTNPKRNNFIKNLAIKCTGTTLVIFRFLEQGKMLLDLITAEAGNRPVYYITGDTKKDDREVARLASNSNDSIVIASFGVFSTGVNLPAIENIIIASPVKGGITYFQTIGRGLRLKSGKTHCNLFDIGDNLNWKSHVNYTHKHFGERMVALTREGYTFTISNIPF